MATIGKVDLDDVAANIVGLFPSFDLLEQRLSLELYRLLARGQPVPRSMLADRVGHDVETINRILDRWPAVFSDAQQRIVGYWGLSISDAYASPHRLTIDGQRLSAWCAWDTLFLPQLLGQSAMVESTSPAAGAIVHLTVTPERLVRVDPVDAHVSFVVPERAGMEEDIVGAFCCFVHFFPSRAGGESWIARHPGTFLLSIDQAFDLSRRKNAAQYQKVLR